MKTSPPTTLRAWSPPATEARKRSWDQDGYVTGTGTGQFHGIFNSMTGEGYTLIASSGDSGSAQDCVDAVQVNWPASDPNFIAAGGTALNLDSSGNFLSEVAWTGDTWSGACASNWGGGGGGQSKLFSEPYWQTPLRYTMRAMPDISLNADPDVTWEKYYYGGGWSSFDGTSIVAPELAGFFAQENAYLDYVGSVCGSAGTSACSPMGNPAPYIYYDGIDGAPHNPFYDITSGCNSNDITDLYGLTTYCAKTGYDLVTGWGSANMLQLAWGINWELIPAYGNPRSLSMAQPQTPGTTATSSSLGIWPTREARASRPPVRPDSRSVGTPSLPIRKARLMAVPATPSTADRSIHSPHSGAWTCRAPFAKPLPARAATPSMSKDGTTRVAPQQEPTDRSAMTASLPPSAYPTTPCSLQAAGGSSSVVVTLTPSDPGGSNASGIYRTYYAVDSSSCVPGSVSSCSIYTAPFIISVQGQHYIYYFTEDKSGQLQHRDLRVGEPRSDCADDDSDTERNALQREVLLARERDSQCHGYRRQRRPAHVLPDQWRHDDYLHGIPVHRFDGWQRYREVLECGQRRQRGDRTNGGVHHCRDRRDNEHSGAGQQAWNIKREVHVDSRCGSHMVQIFGWARAVWVRAASTPRAG